MRRHSGKKRLGAVLLSLALCLSLLPTAALAADSVDYIYYEWDETTQTLSEPQNGSVTSATEVKANDTAWGTSGETSWYVAQGNVTISSRVTVTGDVRLILADDAELTASKGIQVASGNSLTIYGQAGGTGELTATGSGYYDAGIGGGRGGDGGEITIYGGTVVSATSSYTGAGIGGGYEGDGSTITIYGGTVSATSSYAGAGIGGGYEGDGSTITIYGGTVSASSGITGAGIGGGSGGDGVRVTISGGTVTATGGSAGGAGIGGGWDGAAGTFSTGNNGHAVIFASSIQDTEDESNPWRGVIFEGDRGQVYGTSVTPTEDFTILEGKTLTIETGKTLVIQEGVTLTISEGATVTNNGTITGQGSLKGDGTVINNGEMSVTNNDFMATVTVSAEPSPATYNSDVSLMANVTDGSEQIDSGTVTFYRGEVNDANELNSNPINVTSGTATHTIATLDWKPGSYTITAVYTPADDSELLESTGSTTLTVNKAEQSATPSAPSASSVTADSITLNEITSSGQGAVQYGYTTGTESSAQDARWQTGTTFTGLTAATAYTFYARYAENDYYEPSGPSDGVTIYTAHAAPEDDEGYTINYADETVTANIGYEVKLPDDENWAASGTALSIIPGGSFQVRHAETEDGAPASAAVAFTIPARPDAPDVTGGVERIQGATTAMEYRTGDGAWTQFTQATVGRLDPGTYTVRLAATASAFASDPVTVEVTQYTPPANPNYRIDVTTTEGGTVDKDPAAAKAGTEVTLTVTPEEGYQVGTVTVTDRFGEAVEVTENADGTYTFTMPNGQVRVEVTFVEAAPEPLPFTDVNEGDWFHDAVRYVYDNGLMDGVGDNQFAPNATTTRAQLVTILYRLAGEPAVSGDVGFADVAVGQWYTDAVAWAAQKGIVNGISETEFAPSGDLTREQLATILYRYAESMGYDVSASADLSGFPDAGDIQSYATQALSWAVAEGLLQGFEDDSLQPGGTATRAQIATILMRFCESMAK